MGLLKNILVFSGGATFGVMMMALLQAHRVEQWKTYTGEKDGRAENECQSEAGSENDERWTCGGESGR